MSAVFICISAKKEKSRYGDRSNDAESLTPSYVSTVRDLHYFGNTNRTQNRPHNALAMEWARFRPTRSCPDAPGSWAAPTGGSRPCCSRDWR